MQNLSSSFVENTKLTYGENGEIWLNHLPKTIAHLAGKWNLYNLEPYVDLSYNYVAKGLQGSTNVVLKLGFDLSAMEREYFALRAFKDHGVVTLLDADLSHGALLLQCASPGQTLDTLFPEQDLAALKISAELVMKLHEATIPSEHKFPLLTEWLQIIDEEWDVSKTQLQLARALKAELLEQSTTHVLLHGDVHFTNILAHDDDWLIIDPKGVIGDPLYDLTGALLREPFAKVMQSASIETVLDSRIAAMANLLGQNRRVIWAWTYVQTVMSICWSLEDNQDVVQKRKFLNILQLLDRDYA